MLSCFFGYPYTLPPEYSPDLSIALKDHNAIESYSCIPLPYNLVHNLRSFNHIDFSIFFMIFENISFTSIPHSQIGNFLTNPIKGPSARRYLKDASKEH